jgi:hypothetical protein
MAIDILGQKDPSLRHLVSELQRRAPDGTFIVVDHWEMDPFAIGLASPAHPDQLAYISSLTAAEGKYFMSRELPSDSDLVPFRDGGAEQYTDIDTLAAAILDHLGAP